MLTNVLLFLIFIELSNIATHLKGIDEELERSRKNDGYSEVCDRLCTFGLRA